MLVMRGTSAHMHGASVELHKDCGRKVPRHVAYGSNLSVDLGTPATDEVSPTAHAGSDCARAGAHRLKVKR